MKYAGERPYSDPEKSARPVKGAPRPNTRRALNLPSLTVGCRGTSATFEQVKARWREPAGALLSRSADSPQTLCRGR